MQEPRKEIGIDDSLKELRRDGCDHGLHRPASEQIYVCTKYVCFPSAIQTDRTRAVNVLYMMQCDRTMAMKQSRAEKRISAAWQLDSLVTR